MKTKNTPPILAAVSFVSIFLASCTGVDSNSPGSSLVPAKALISHTCAPWDGAAFTLTVKKSPNTLTPLEMTVFGALPAEGSKAVFKMDGVSEQGHGKFAEKRKGKLELSMQKGVVSGVVRVNARPDVYFVATINPEAAVSSCGGVIKQAAQSDTAVEPIKSVAKPLDKAVEKKIEQK